MWQLSFLVFITTKAAPASLERVLARLTLVELAAVGHGYRGGAGNYQGHVFLSVVLSVTSPYRRNCADSDRMVAVAVTFISLLHTLLSNHSLGAVLASLAGPTVFPLSSVYPGAKLCSSLGLWHGGCLLRNVIKYTLPCSPGPLVPGNTLTHPEELLPAPVFFQGLSLDSAWLL